MGTEIVTDPDLHEALLLMRAAGILHDRMHLDDDWEFPEHMKELVPLQGAKLPATALLMLPLCFKVVR